MNLLNIGDRVKLYAALGLFLISFVGLIWVGIGAKSWERKAHKAEAQVVTEHTERLKCEANARELAAELTKILGQSFYVENRPGASNIIGTDVAAKAPNDGYSLYIGTTSSLSVVPHLYGKLPFNAERDFAPISLMGVLNTGLIANPGVQARDAKELIAQLKARPESVSVATQGIGSYSHLSAVWFNNAAGVKSNLIPYNITITETAPDAGSAIVLGTIQGKIKINSSTLQWNSDPGTATISFSPAADGVVASGRTSANEVMLTGESRPVSKGTGDRVIGGAINGEGAVTVTVRQTGGESFLSGVIRLVRDAQASKSRTQDIANRAAFWLTVVALSVSAITLASWLLLAPNGLAYAVERAVTVLVIFAWLYVETGSTERVAALAHSLFWMFLPSLTLFLVLPALLRAGVAFWPSLAAASAATAVAYGVLLWVLGRCGIAL